MGRAIPSISNAARMGGACRANIDDCACVQWLICRLHSAFASCCAGGCDFIQNPRSEAIPMLLTLSRTCSISKFAGSTPPVPWLCFTHHSVARTSYLGPALAGPYTIVHCWGRRRAYGPPLLPYRACGACRSVVYLIHTVHNVASTVFMS